VQKQLDNVNTFSFPFSHAAKYKVENEYLMQERQMKDKQMEREKIYFDEIM